MPRLKVPDVLLRTLSRQLGGPSGAFGAVVARMLNKGNGPAIRAAVQALELQGDEAVADIGFGGGYGLELLLTAVPRGVVHGVEPSTDMLARARRTHTEEFASGRLQLHEAPMQSLPLPDGSLDGWISLNTIYFVDDLPAALHELSRVLAPTGRGVLGVADPDWMSEQAFTRYNFTLRPVDDVVAALKDARLEVEHRRLEGGRVAYHLLVCRRYAD